MNVSSRASAFPNLVLTDSLHAQRAADRGVTAHAPDFRVEVVVQQRVAPDEAGGQLRGERLGVGGVVDVLARHLIPDAEGDADDEVVDETAADDLGRAVASP